MLLPAVNPLALLFEFLPIYRLGPFGHHCLYAAGNNFAFLIKFNIRDDKVLFFIFGSDSGPFAVVQFFGVYSIHRIITL